MKRQLNNFVFLLIVAQSVVSIAQNSSDIERELNRLQLVLQRTNNLITLIPDANLKLTLSNEFEKARNEFEKGKSFFNQRKFNLARSHIRFAYQYLRNIEKRIKNVPFLRIRFRERLDSRIQQAEELVQANPRNESLNMLNRAKFFRQKAYLSAQSDKSIAALEYSRLAIFFADKAIQFSTPDFQQTFRDWQNYYHETESLLNRAKNSVEIANNLQLQGMIQNASQELEQIREMYTKGKENSARQRLVAVNRSIYRILDLSENVPQKDHERLQIDLQTLKVSLQSMENEFHPNVAPATQHLYSRLNNLVMNIEKNIEINPPEMTRKKLVLANRMLLRIYRMLDEIDESQPNELNQQINQTQQNITEMRNSISSDHNLNDLLSLASSNLERSEIAYNNQRYLESSNYLKIANNLLLKISRLKLSISSLERENERVKSDLDRLENLISNLSDSQNDDPDFQIRYENAKKLFQIAQSAYAENDLYRCSEITNMGINLITK
jgi:hypothetical protein